MLSQGTDYLVCPDHKNSKTYGSMAKWLTPGARRAVELYRQVPRRPEVQTFLVPAMESISRVDIFSAFMTFCSLKLSASKTRPTGNLMRKFLTRVSWISQRMRAS